MVRIQFFQIFFCNYYMDTMFHINYNIVIEKMIFYFSTKGPIINVLDYRNVIIFNKPYKAERFKQLAILLEF